MTHFATHFHTTREPENINTKKTLALTGNYHVHYVPSVQLRSTSITSQSKRVYQRQKQNTTPLREKRQKQLLIIALTLRRCLQRDNTQFVMTLTLKKKSASQLATVKTRMAWCGWIRFHGRHCVVDLIFCYKCCSVINACCCCCCTISFSFRRGNSYLIEVSNLVHGYELKVSQEVVINKDSKGQCATIEKLDINY